MRKFFIFTISTILLTCCAGSKERLIVVKENRFYTCEPASTIQNNMVKLINHIRSSKRRCAKKTFSSADAVKWNQKLASAAFNHARDMAMNDMLSHTGSDGSTVRARIEKRRYYWGVVAGEYSRWASDL